MPFITEITVTHPQAVSPGESTIGTARHITMMGGVAIVETVVYWNPPHCYAYSGQGKHFPMKNYVGLFAIEPVDAQSGRLLFREYFDDMGFVEQASSTPWCALPCSSMALGNLARLIGGMEYAMTAVSRL